MGIQTKIHIKEDKLTLKKLLRKCQNIKEERRLKLFMILKDNPNIRRKDIEKALNFHRSTIKRLINRYNQEGIELIFSDRTKNKKSRIISDEISDGLEKRVKNKLTPFLSYVDAVNWVEEIYGKQVNYYTLRKFLKSKFGTKIKSPRRSHVLKDPKAEVAFLKTP